MQLTPKIIPFEELSSLAVDETANTNPLMSEAKFRGTLNDIKVLGQTDPVIIFDNKLMDGRNRLSIIKKLNLDLKAIVLSGCTREEAIHCAKSKNNFRRHMDKSQVAMKAAKEIFINRTNEDGTLKKRSDWFPLSQHEDILSGELSKRTLEKAVSILKNHPKVAELIFNGVKTLPQVERVLKLQKDEEERRKIEIGCLEDSISDNPFTIAVSSDLVYIDDENINHLECDYSLEVVNNYKYYVSEFPKENLALKLVKTEEELKEIKLE